MNITDQLADVRARIEAVDRPFHHHVDVLPVTKGFGGGAIEAAAAAGCTVVGENYAQDLLSKVEVIERRQMGVEFIGQLQSNKVRQLVDVVTVWATLDRPSIIAEVAKRAPGARVLIQVNATGEDRKGGCGAGAVSELIERAGASGLVVDGLMTVGPTGQPPESARGPFETVRQLVDDYGLSTCSMGMSADLEVAVSCGSTQVRIGSGLFGPRP